MIPDRWSDHSVFWERLSDHVVVTRMVHGREIVFLVERPRRGHVHHCTVDDVARVLELLPVEHVFWIDLVVFRQPTRKQSILSPVWGRMAYWSEVGAQSGMGIYLESQERNLVLDWSRSLGPELKAELRRSERFGFRVEQHSRGFRIHGSASAIRAVQLYHTVPHEVGHAVDYHECRDQFGDDVESERFLELYDAKPVAQKEAFAHRYADGFRATVELAGGIPFAPVRSPEVLEGDQLDESWFASAS